MLAAGVHLVLTWDMQAMMRMSQISLLPLRENWALPFLWARWLLLTTILQPTAPHVARDALTFLAPRDEANVC